MKLSCRDSVPLKPSKVAACEMKWSTSALQAVHRVDAHLRDEVVKKIEKKAKADKRRGVDLAAVYNAKLEQKLLFPKKVDFVYSRHVGPVSCIDVSPFNSKIFATGGTDGEVRVYNVLVKKPLLRIFCDGGVNSVKWSKTRPMVLAVGEEGGNLLVYDFLRDSEAPVSRLTGR